MKSGRPNDYHVTLKLPDGRTVTHSWLDHAKGRAETRAKAHYEQVYKVTLTVVGSKCVAQGKDR